jgi:6,7-dimethyl-8-ribityllumazine synthase
MTDEVTGSAEWNNVKVGIAAARWNSMITDEMIEGAEAALRSKGIPEENIILVRCPGSYELPFACKQLLENLDVDGVVAIGAVIRGDTPHFEYVCDAVNRGILELNLKYNRPVAFGVLTTDNVEQAMQRSSKDEGNKGAEAALALCEMIALSTELRKRKK